MNGPAEAADIRIRPARSGEARPLSALALRSKALWGYDPEFLERCRPVLTVTPEQVRDRPTFLAEEGGSVAGFYALRERGPDVELDFLFVEPAAIGRGVGSALLAHALRTASAMGWARMVVESDPGAEPFYLRRGARRVGTVPSGVRAGRELPLLEFGLAGDARRAQVSNAPASRR